MASVTPVFILNNQLPAFDQVPFTTAEICHDVEKNSGFESIDGAQRIGGLWRIYPRSSQARNTVLVQGFNIRGIQVDVKNKNPFVISSPNGEEREIPATRLTISNVPLSYSDDDIMHAVKALKVTVRSKLIDERDRDKHGKLTRWRTGRRFLYIDVPTVPLPKSVEMGPFKAALYHKEQKFRYDCVKCLGNGHQSAVCDRPVKCRQCFADGHKAGDPLCNMIPAMQQENSGSRKPSPSLRNDSKSPQRDSPNRMSTSTSQNNTSTSASGKEKRSGHKNITHTQNKQSASSGSPRPPRSQAKSRDRNRGRTPTRREKHVNELEKGQTTLNYTAVTSRSASGKRPLSDDTTPKHQSTRTNTDEKTTIILSLMNNWKTVKYGANFRLTFSVLLLND